MCTDTAQIIVKVKQWVGKNENKLITHIITKLKLSLSSESIEIMTNV
jgi:hypothetical protein